MQIDRQHGVDLVIGGKNRNGNGDSIQSVSGQLGWFRAPENPRDVAAWTWYPLTSDITWTMSLIAVDMDNDGNLDILVTDTQECFWLRNPGTKDINKLLMPWERIKLCENEGRGTPNKSTTHLLFGCVADLDSDGLEDVLVATRPRIVYWLRRLDASGRNWEKIPISVDANVVGLKGIAVGNINGDGKQEIVLSCESNENTHGLIWLSYDKSPKESWKAHVLSGLNGIKFDQVFLYDFNGDGKLDVITTEELSGSSKNGLGVIWYENPF
jgi:hypothetical protein